MNGRSTLCIRTPVILRILAAISDIMKYIALSVLFAALLFSCSTQPAKPDVSGIPIKLDVLRFDQDLFQLDTTDMPRAMQELQQKYPGFLRDFMDNILGVPVNSQEAPLVLQKFITDFRPIYRQSQPLFSDIKGLQADVRSLLQHIQFYFPDYAAPQKMITFIGPMDAFYETSLGWSGDIITTDGLGIGLQLHLGSQQPLYQETDGRGYPAYISRRFEPSYMVVNCARNIIDDLYPDFSREKALIDQMIDKGKRLYAIDRLLPEVADTLKIGYTAAQLAACEKNEALIWTFFLQNQLLFETDFQKIKPYVTDGPKTQELGDDAPGFIALYMGKKIVESFMEKHPDVTLPQLMTYDARKLFEEAKYKPGR